MNKAFVVALGAVLSVPAIASGTNDGFKYVGGEAGWAFVGRSQADRGPASRDVKGMETQASAGTGDGWKYVGGEAGWAYVGTSQADRGPARRE